MSTTLQAMWGNVKSHQVKQLNSDDLCMDISLLEAHWIPFRNKEHFWIQLLHQKTEKALLEMEKKLFAWTVINDEKWCCLFDFDASDSPTPEGAPSTLEMLQQALFAHCLGHLYRHLDARNWCVTGDKVTEGETGHVFQWTVRIIPGHGWYLDWHKEDITGWQPLSSFQQITTHTPLIILPFGYPVQLYSDNVSLTETERNSLLGTARYAPERCVIQWQDQFWLVSREMLAVSWSPSSRKETKPNQSFSSWPVLNEMSKVTFENAVQSAIPETKWRVTDEDWHYFGKDDVDLDSFLAELGPEEAEALPMNSVIRGSALAMEKVEMEMQRNSSSPQSLYSNCEMSVDSAHETLPWPDERIPRHSSFLVPSPFSPLPFSPLSCDLSYSVPSPTLTHYSMNAPIRDPSKPPEWFTALLQRANQHGDDKIDEKWVETDSYWHFCIYLHYKQFQVMSSASKSNPWWWPLQQTLCQSGHSICNRNERHSLFPIPNDFRIVPDYLNLSVRNNLYPVDYLVQSVREEFVDKQTCIKVQAPRALLQHFPSVPVQPISGPVQVMMAPISIEMGWSTKHLEGLTHYFHTCRLGNIQILAPTFLNTQKSQWRAWWNECLTQWRRLENEKVALVLLIHAKELMIVLQHLVSLSELDRCLLFISHPIQNPSQEAHQLYSLVSQSVTLQPNSHPTAFDAHSGLKKKGASRLLAPQLADHLTLIEKILFIVMDCVDQCVIVTQCLSDLSKSECRLFSMPLSLDILLAWWRSVKATRWILHCTETTQSIVSGLKEMDFMKWGLRSVTLFQLETCINVKTDASMLPDTFIPFSLSMNTSDLNWPVPCLVDKQRVIAQKLARGNSISLLVMHQQKPSLWLTRFSLVHHLAMPRGLIGSPQQGWHLETEHLNATAQQMTLSLQETILNDVALLMWHLADAHALVFPSDHENEYLPWPCAMMRKMKGVLKELNAQGPVVHSSSQTSQLFETRVQQQKAKMPLNVK